MSIDNTLETTSETNSGIKIGETTATWAKSQGFFNRYFPVTTSTNDIAKKEAFTPDLLENEFCLYLTDEQTAGRGRLERTWTSPQAGGALLSSWSFQVDSAPQPIFTTLAGLALYASAKATWPFLDWHLKSPNDLYIKNKKVAGLLVETVSQGSEYRLIIGLGINILSHPAEIDTSTCLLKNLNAEAPLLGEDWISFIERLFFEFSRLIPQITEEPTTTQMQSLLYVLNQFPLLEKKYSSFADLKAELWR